MEEVVDDLHMGSPLAEGAVVLGVHVHRNGLHATHPTLAHGLDEMQHLFLLLALLTEQHIPTLNINDHRRVPVAPVQQELIDGDVGAVPLGRPFREQGFQPALVDLFHDRRMDVQQARDLAERQSHGQVFDRLVPQMLGDAVMGILEGKVLARDVPTSRAAGTHIGHRQ